MRMRDIAVELESRAAVAREVATASPVPDIGAAAAAHAYEDGAALVLANASDRPSGRNAAKATCGCRNIRVFPSVLEQGPIVCGVCGEDFE